MVPAAGVQDKNPNLTQAGYRLTGRARSSSSRT